MNLKSIIESILFSIGEPVSLDKLSRVLDQKKEIIEKTLKELSIEYEKEDRGVSIIEKNNHFQMVSNPKNASYIERLIKDDLQEDLTPANLEVLAIIAYKGPITRMEIEEIRGVNSSYTLRNLLIRGLIERKPHPDDARTYLYEISFDFLRKLGLNSVNDLPDYEKYKEIV